jgi:hypothetical protein
MIVHLYAQCWNDERMLPFFFRHYDRLVDRYFIFDDGSVDATAAILASHPCVQLGRLPRSAPDSFVLYEQAFSNACWKQSRGEADWVIVTDIDEHLFHPEGREYLQRCGGAGVTLIPALGFQMISEKPPEPADDLPKSHRLGSPWIQMMKPSIFNPAAVTEINFTPGRHRARPEGRVKVPERDEMMLFHYKYLGLPETLERHRMLSTGLGTQDREMGWGHKYAWSESELRSDWNQVSKNAVDTEAIVRERGWSYPIPAWWERYR